jgi:hypothetical protein
MQRQYTHVNCDVKSQFTCVVVWSGLLNPDRRQLTGTRGMLVVIPKWDREPLAMTRRCRYS